MKSIRSGITLLFASAQKEVNSKLLHVYFPIAPITDSEKYKALKVAIQAKYPFYDKNALDAGRFIFGCCSEEVIWHDGEKTIADIVSVKRSSVCIDQMGMRIPEGARNNAMFRWALQQIKLYGDTTETKRRFFAYAEHCVPRLPVQELNSIWCSAAKYVNQGRRLPSSNTLLVASSTENWDAPIPLTSVPKLTFPVDALPPAIAEYVIAVSEATQTPVDMAGTAAITLLAACMQGKYVVEGKSGWIEPTNLFATIVALPSERKSAVLRLMTKPIDEFEQQYNKNHAAARELSNTKRRLLEQKRKKIEEQVAEGKADITELEDIIQELTSFVEEKPLQLYVDDITTEKLASVMARNNGRAAIISAEGGIFDILAGLYTKNVNLDIMLKGYSGDTIRVDRIGRDSESIMRPVLSVLLMTQPFVITKVLKNEIFRGRGLTARFLYGFPASRVGERRFETDSIDESTYQRYEGALLELLQEEYTTSPIKITLSSEAKNMLAAFHAEIEPKLAFELEGIADWAGKLLGNILRISALLYRASISGTCNPDRLIIDGHTMGNALRLGRYYLNHAQVVFDTIQAEEIAVKARKILQMINDQQLGELTRREVQRKCRSFKSAEEVQAALDYLEEHGYIRYLYDGNGGGRKPQRYEVNPSAVTGER